MAAVAQAERAAISRRVSEALAVAEARGVKPGSSHVVENFRMDDKGGVALRVAVSANAASSAVDLPTSARMAIRP